MWDQSLHLAGSEHWNHKVAKRPIYGFNAQHNWTRPDKYVVGPAGLEPATKGFTVSPCFQREWTISSPANEGFHS